MEALLLKFTHLGNGFFHSEIISSPFQLSRVFYLRKYLFKLLPQPLPTKLVERCVPGIQGFLCGAGYSPVAGCVHMSRVGCYPEFYCILSKLSYVNNVFKLLLFFPLKH